MRKKVVKTIAVTIVMVLLFTFVFSMTVFADWTDESGVEWWEHGISGIWGEYWRALQENQDLYWNNYVNERISWSEKTGIPNYFTQSRDFYTVSGTPSGGGGGGVRGEGTGPSGGGGGGVRGHVDKVATGQTSSHSLVTYNSTTNNYTLNMPTYNTTNNYYETYNIKNIYYNNTYNTYHFQTTNNYNYYITYSPTYININYLDSGSGTLCDFTYFYELPDGRNSWDLSASEVYGMYFMYNATNYDMVVEDGATLALYHFDGNINDSSSCGGSAKYVAGGSHNYVDHGQFNQAMYWGNGTQELQVTLPQSSSAMTLEFMAYFTYPTPTVVFDNDSFSVTNSFIDSHDSTKRANYKSWNWPAPDYYLTDSVFAEKSIGEWQWTYLGNGVTRYSKTDTYEFKKVYCYFLSYGGLQLFPIYAHGEIQIDYDFAIYESPDTVLISTKTGIPNSANVSLRSCELSVSDVVKGQTGFGEWTYFAAEISGGGSQCYRNGVPVDMPEWLNEIGGEGGPSGGGGGGVRDGNTVVLQKPYEWNNYWYIDELRVSSGSLYGGSYNPQNHPFDTNKVMVLPDSGNHGDIAIKSSIPVKDFRVGGARPTYPVVGDVFISVEKTSTQHKVESVQQYQSGGWVTVDGAVRVDGEWLTLKSYDLKSFTIDETEVPDPGGGTNPGGGSGGDIGDPDDPGFWEKLGEAILAIITGLLSLIGKLVSGIATVISTLFDALFSLVGFSTRFGEFVGAAFAFIPQEIIGVIVVGLTLAIILMIINFFR